MSSTLRLWSGASYLAFAAVTVHSALAAAPATQPKLETVIVVDELVGPDSDAPSKIARITDDEAAEHINVLNTEDMLKYLPAILVRKRHIGDTQDPISTRTSGVGASARSLIYADGILLSALIGNNNTLASPRWGMVAPEDVARIDVIYGPFAAQYPGNSVGAVIEITTRMPDTFEMRAKAEGAAQGFDQYGTHDTYSTYQASAGMGDRLDRFSWRLSANHLNTYSQPLSYVTLARAASANTAGTPVSGAFADVNRTGAPIAVIGAGGLEHQIQDNITLKLAYELGNDMTATYTLGIFNQQDTATAQTYLHDANGDAIYTGSVNIAGYNYSIGANAFASGVSRYAQTQMAHALTLESNSNAWYWGATLTAYDFVRDRQRVPTTALPDALEGGAGAITKMDGTGWYTADLKAIHQFDYENEMSFGGHYDRYELAMQKFATADWLAGQQGPLSNTSRGKTATGALWAQDAWRFATDWKATLGGRFEYWRAFDGLNYSRTPALDVSQPELSGTYFSPKASVSFHPSELWTLVGSYGRAYRMPTVTELYQTITTQSVLSVPNPHLNPERADSYELSAEYSNTDGRVRISLFEEDLADALISQSAPLLQDVNTLFNFVQNIDRVRSRGIEAVADRDDVLIEGLQLSGNVTFVNSHITRDTAFTVAEGKRTPQLPKWRASVVATYRPDAAWAFSLAARYSDRSFGTIDNSDVVSHTFQGFESYLVFDARAHYAIDEHWSAAFGIDNLNNRKYFIYHPFPQRTFLVELKYAQ